MTFLLLLIVLFHNLLQFCSPPCDTCNITQRPFFQKTQKCVIDWKVAAKSFQTWRIGILVHFSNMWERNCSEKKKPVQHSLEWFLRTRGDRAELNMFSVGMCCGCITLDCQRKPLRQLFDNSADNKSNIDVIHCLAIPLFSHNICNHKRIF